MTVSLFGRLVDRDLLALQGHVLHTPNSFIDLVCLPDGFVDVTITDPPYAKHCQSNLVSGSLVGTKNVPKYELDFPPLPTDPTAWLTTLLRITKRWVVIFCTLEEFGRFEAAVGRPAYVRSCVWYKTNAMGQLTADRPASSYEGIAVLHNPDNSMHWNGRGSYGVWPCAGTRGKADRHPNEKPIDLALKLTALFSNPGELVLDPWCGSGALGEAAVRLKRRWIGLDWDPQWVRRATQRVATLQSYSDLAALTLCTMKSVV